ncbi:MAG: hypothetical protein EA403_09670 [Spirochaetaceae bacterium]|nr:MAG: hypothetical protein EA403_09670 [Spirochaetaceae bacterium]
MKRLLLLTVVLLCAGSLFAQSSDRDLFLQAEARFRAGEFEVALERYDALIRQFPVSQFVPDAQFRRAVTLHRLGRHQESLELLQRVETRFRSTRFLQQVPFWKGVAHYRLRNYTTAAADLRLFLSASADAGQRVQALLYLALSEVELGSRPAALAALEQMFEITNPSSELFAASVYLALLLQEGRPQDGVEFFEQLNLPAVGGTRRDTVVLYAAEAYRRSGAVSEAQTLLRGLRGADASVAAVAFQQLFQIAQESGDETALLTVTSEAEQALAGRTDVLAQFWLQVGIETFHQGRFDLSELYLQRVWDLRRSQPVSGTVPLHLAEILAARGERTRAVAVLNDHLERSRDQIAAVLFRLGRLHAAGGDWRRAAEVLTVVFTEHRDTDVFAPAAYQLAFARNRLQQTDDALTVIDDVFSAGLAGQFAGDFLRLRAQIYRSRGALEQALQALREYLGRNPGDLDALIEQATLLFQLERYGQVISEHRDISAAHPSLQSDRPDLSVQLDYLVGLALIAGRDYRAAIAALRRLPDDPESLRALAPERDFEIIHPYALYYLGWAYFRLSEYASAIASFDRLLRFDERHRFAPQAAHLAGWSAYNLERYDAAEGYLRRLRAMRVGGTIETEAAFLLGQTFSARNRYEEALVEFRNVFLDSPNSPLADDALFEYAGVLVRMGRVDDGVQQYRNVFSRFPTGELAEEALFRRGEILFERGRYDDARSAFFEHRSNFAQGELVHASLYWAGIASERLGERAGALLLWEQLIRDHRGSPFRPDAMLRSVTLYEDLGQYRNALNIVTEFIAAYPAQAEALQTRRKADELILLIGGLSEQEARLWVRIDENRRTQTSAGRAAILELGRLAIMEGAGSPANENLVVQLLDDTARLRSEDPAAAAEATFLLAEYQMRSSNPAPAAQLFLSVPEINPENRDLAARSLFRAAEALQFAGRDADMREIIRRLEQTFPASEWTTRARRLLGGTP